MPSPIRATPPRRLLSQLGRYGELRAGHIREWAHLWERFDIAFDDNPDAVRVVRLHLLHLLQTVPNRAVDLDAGVPARGLHGEAYRGHIFWDELFVFPVLNLRSPAMTRSLLRYRYRRLPEARRAAREAGYAGAMFPWQSGSDGREESQKLHLNPNSGHWNPDASARAHHIGIAVAYNVWQYYQVTGDLEYLIENGAEMLAEIARFWVSRSRIRRDAGPLRDPRGDRPRRVPFRLSGPALRRYRQQRLHQRDGGVGDRAGARRARRPAAARPAGPDGALGHPRARTATSGTTSAGGCTCRFHDGT